jgi:group I intron endonuclease
MTCLNRGKDDSVPSRIRAQKKPGLYMIHCLINDWRYFGESSNVSGRLSSHKSMLNRRIHPNFLLQTDYEKYGTDAFKFVILFLGDAWTDVTVRRSQELEEILLNRDRTYNKINPNAKENNPFWNQTHTEDTKKKIGDAMRGIPKKMTHLV